MPENLKSSKAEKRLQEIFDTLYTLYPVEIDLSLGRVERFLEKLDNPHLKLPPVIHVAGTNGKGSTIAILRSILESMGYSVHVMTSPHLVHPTERIRLAGQLISTDAFIDVLEECMAINNEEPITFFEMFTAASFLAMSRTPADFALIETGMGGRLDATNVIPHPICTIITTIAEDHKEYLGDTLEKIAGEKAGIMKKDVPCVIGKQTDKAVQEGVLNVFTLNAEKLSAPLSICGTDWHIDPHQNHLKFTSDNISLSVAIPNLEGQHQINNAGAAIEAARLILGDDFKTDRLAPDSPNNPLKHIDWPGRLQKLENGKLFKHLQKDQEIWIDGGHNENAGQALAVQAKRWTQTDQKPLHLIIAMVDRKDPGAFLKDLLPHAQSTIVTTIENEPASYKIETLYETILTLRAKNLQKAENVENAVKQITSQNKECRILITGSLYLMGTILP